MGVVKKTVLVAGLGNVGSPVPALLLQAGVEALRLVDRDVVEAKNLVAQDYRAEDVGRFKAEVIAERLRVRFPDRGIEAYAVDLEDLPGGVAEMDLILGALDSRQARQLLVSELAWRQGVPVVDGGVGDGDIGRVQVFVPGEASACLECTWGVGDYRLAAAEYPCAPGEAARVAATGAPAYLGSFTACLMVREAMHLLDNPRNDKQEESYEIVFDLNQHVMRRFALKRNARCRFDHCIHTAPLDPQQTIRSQRSLPWNTSIS